VFEEIAFLARRDLSSFSVGLIPTSFSLYLPTVSPFLRLFPRSAVFSGRLAFCRSTPLHHFFFPALFLRWEYPAQPFSVFNQNQHHGLAPPKSFPQALTSFFLFSFNDELADSYSRIPNIPFTAQRSRVPRRRDHVPTWYAQWLRGTVTCVRFFPLSGLFSFLSVADMSGLTTMPPG